MEKSEVENKISIFDMSLKYSALVLAISGILIIIIFLIIISYKFSLINGELDMSSTGQVGDFIGGVVGSMWAFSGVILFFLALRLQRKEFSSQTEQLKLQKDELKLQRKELKNQRQEFRIGRITNIIYKQKEIIDEQRKKLYLRVTSKGISSRGREAINRFGFWSNLCIPKNISKKEFSDKQNQEFTEFNSFMSDNSCKDYINALKNSIELCIDLISQIDSDGEFMSNFESRSLMFLLLKNFDLENNLLMFIEMLRIQKLQLEQAKENDTSGVGIGFFNQEIDKINMVLNSIKSIREKCS